MKNKRNKKLLASILLSMSLISSISNKAANAYYKDEDRRQLNELVISINNFTNSKKNAGEVSENLFSTIKNIYNNRHKKNPNSVLYKSMRENMHINENLNIEKYIEKYKQYGPDALKAMFLELDVDKFKGGHFTVWNEKTKAAINALAKEVPEQINCCDAWFWALGGTKQDIEECKSKLNSECGDYSDIIDSDTHRTWVGVKDANVKKKEEILNRVLKVYDSDYHNYTQGFNHWCAIIIDKFVGCENNGISKETEAQIYYVYEAIINKLCSSVDKICDNNKVENKVFTPKTKVVLDDGTINNKLAKKLAKELAEAFVLSNKGVEYSLPLIDNFIDNHKDLSEPMKVNLYCSASDIVGTNVVGCYGAFNRNLKIKLLDEMIYKDFKNKQTEEIVQNIINEVCMAIVDDDVDKGAHGILSDMSCGVYFSLAKQYLLDNSSSKLEFSNNN